LPKQELVFQAVKHRYSEDDDGEATLTFKVHLKDKLVAFAIPAKKLLLVKVTESEEQ
jgi:hypothetical protein